MIRVGNAGVEIEQGDISRATTEAVVNAANNRLWMGAGVAGALKRAGGPSIEREAVAQGPIDVGEAVVTGGGNLAAKVVIHAAGMGADLRTDAGKVRTATAASMRRAEENGIRSITFPAIGTGVGGLPLETCAEVMLDAVIKHLKTTQCIEEVRFCLFDDAGRDAFERVLRGRFPEA